MAETPYTPPRSVVDGLPQPPSAKSSKTFGILGICSHLLCLLGAPFAILFGILALVRHGRAKREHAEYPETYAPPRATGLVTGIVALAMLVTVLPSTGIAAAIAIPALLGQREKSKIRAVQSLVNNAAGEIARAGDAMAARTPGRPVPADALVQTFLARPESRYPMVKNPYGGSETPYHLGAEPRGLGWVALEPVQSFPDPVTGEPHPSIVIRGSYSKAGNQVVVSKIVAID